MSILLSIKFLFWGIVISTIGALPFGLVNLSVAETANRINIHEARKIAIGASIVEVIFSLLALLVNNGILSINRNNQLWNYTSIGILSTVAFYFFFKNNNTKKEPENPYFKGIAKGLVLNTISIQVFLFWVFAIVYASTINTIPTSALEIILFIVGVFIAKLFILEIYGYVGIKILKKSVFIEKNINRVIGTLLLLVVLFQITKV